MSESGEHKIRWDKAFIYTDDLIFPSENQIRYWDGKADTYITEGSHCPDFLEIIDHTLPDILTIKDQFHKSRGTYDKNALAQRDIARNLLSLLSEWNPANRSNILEIGSGTGILTSLYMSGLNPGKVTLVDLVHSENTRACDQMEYIEADAETWISMTQNKWDIVLSSSTIQWFSDLKRFIINCQRVLNPGGILAISGFTQGNLSEFDHIRNNPLAYPTKKEVVTILSGLFKEFKVTDEEMKVTFPTKRDALLHLKKTGVSTTHTRSGDAAIGLKSISDCIPSDEQGNVFLTYRPLYILARK